MGFIPFLIMTNVWQPSVLPKLWNILTQNGYQKCDIGNKKYSIKRMLIT